MHLFVCSFRHTVDHHRPVVESSSNTCIIWNSKKTYIVYICQCVFFYLHHSKNMGSVVFNLLIITTPSNYLPIIYHWYWSPVGNLVVGLVRLCVHVSMQLSVWIYIYLSNPGRNFLILSPLMGYDVGMMPVVFNFWYCLVSQMQTEIFVSEKGFHAIRIGNSNIAPNALR